MASLGDRDLARHWQTKGGGREEPASSTRNAEAHQSKAQAESPQSAGKPPSPIRGGSPQAQPQAASNEPSAADRRRKLLQVGYHLNQFRKSLKGIISAAQSLESNNPLSRTEMRRLKKIHAGLPAWGKKNIEALDEMIQQGRPFISDDDRAFVQLASEKVALGIRNEIISASRQLLELNKQFHQFVRLDKSKTAPARELAALEIFDLKAFRQAGRTGQGMISEAQHKAFNTFLQAIQEAAASEEMIRRTQAEEEAYAAYERRQKKALNRALLNGPKETVVPYATANIIAKSFGIANIPPEAMEDLLKGKVQAFLTLVTHNIDRDWGGKQAEALQRMATLFALNNQVAVGARKEKQVSKKDWGYIRFMLAEAQLQSDADRQVRAGLQTPQGGHSYATSRRHLELLKVFKRNDMSRGDFVDLMHVARNNDEDVYNMRTFFEKKAIDAVADQVLLTTLEIEFMLLGGAALRGAKTAHGLVRAGIVVGETAGLAASANVLPEQISNITGNAYDSKTALEYLGFSKAASQKATAAAAWLSIIGGLGTGVLSWRHTRNLEKAGRLALALEAPSIETAEQFVRGASKQARVEAGAAFDVLSKIPPSVARHGGVTVVHSAEKSVDTARALRPLPDKTVTKVGDFDIKTFGTKASSNPAIPTDIVDVDTLGIDELSGLIGRMRKGGDVEVVNGLGRLTEPDVIQLSRPLSNVSGGELEQLARRLGNIEMGQVTVRRVRNGHTTQTAFLVRGDENSVTTIAAHKRAEQYIGRTAQTDDQFFITDLHIHPSGADTLYPAPSWGPTRILGSESGDIASLPGKQDVYSGLTERLATGENVGKTRASIKFVDEAEILVLGEKTGSLLSKYDAAGNARIILPDGDSLVLRVDVGYGLQRAGLEQTGLSRGGWKNLREGQKGALTNKLPPGSQSAEETMRGIELYAAGKRVREDYRKQLSGIVNQLLEDTSKLSREQLTAWKRLLRQRLSRFYRTHPLENIRVNPVSGARGVQRAPKASHAGERSIVDNLELGPAGNVSAGTSVETKAKPSLAPGNLPSKALPHEAQLASQLAKRRVYLGPNTIGYAGRFDIMQNDAIIRDEMLSLSALFPGKRIKIISNTNSNSLGKRIKDPDAYAMDKRVAEKVNAHNSIHNPNAAHITVEDIFNPSTQTKGFDEIEVHLYHYSGSNPNAFPYQTGLHQTSIHDYLYDESWPRVSDDSRLSRYRVMLGPNTVGYRGEIGTSSKNLRLEFLELSMRYPGKRLIVISGTHGGVQGRHFLNTRNPNYRGRWFVTMDREAADWVNEYNRVWKTGGGNLVVEDIVNPQIQGPKGFDDVHVLLRCHSGSNINAFPHSGGLKSLLRNPYRIFDR